MLKLSKIILPHTSLRLNLIVACEVVLLLFLSLAVLFFFSRHVLKEEAKQDAEQALEGTVQHIDNILTNVEQTAYNTYQDLQGHLNQPERMTVYCTKVVETNPYVVGCAIVFKPNYYPGRELFMTYVHRDTSKPGNQVLITSSSFGSRPYPEHVWYKTPMATGRACWTNPLMEEENEGVTLSFCLPIFDHQQCVGALVLDVPIALLSEIIPEVKPSPHCYSVLLDSKGSYIVHPDVERLKNQKTVFSLLEEKESPSMREAAEAVMSGETGYKTFEMDHEDWYVFYKPFHRNAEIGQPVELPKWSVGMVFMKDDILGNHNILFYLVLGITLFGVLTFYFLCRWLIRRHMKPLCLLTRSAQRVAEGHYDEIVPNSQREDEIGQLQDYFQHMQQSLSSKSAELEQMTEMLKERSQDLQHAYRYTQGSDRMKNTFLNYMTTQMTVPSDVIERSVTKLSNNYHDIDPEEASHEVEIIKEQSEKVLDLLDHMVEALKIEAEEVGKEVGHE